MRYHTITLDDRELATVLATLRIYQQTGDASMDDLGVECYFDPTDEHPEGLDPLGPEEVDDLLLRINCESEEVPLGPPASPEMFAILEDLIDWAELMGGWEAQVWDRAREAVARARGGQPS